MNTVNIQFTLQDIYELHAQLESAFVLSPGVRDENLLASAVYTPFQTFMEKDLYPSIYDKAAQLCYGLAVNDTLRMYKNDDIRMYNFNCITDTIVEVITTCNTYTLLTVHLL